MSRFLNLLLCPQAPLQPNFPWAARTSAARYGKSLVYFAAGSFAVPLLFNGTVFTLTFYPDLFFRFTGTSNEAVAVILCLAGASGALATLSGYALLAACRYIKRRVDVLPACTACGALLAVYALLGAVAWLPVPVVLMTWLVKCLTGSYNGVNITLVTVLAAVSFVMGFGMQMNYISRCLKKDGLSLVEVMSLNLRARRGRSRLSTAWNVILPVGLAYGLMQMAGLAVVCLLGPCRQPTVDMLRQASGSNFLVFFLLAGAGAPLFEELVFRGFLFQIVRSSLRHSSPILLKAAPLPGDGRLLKVRLLWNQADNYVRRYSYALTSQVKRLLACSPDFSALLISSAMFALLHLQFNQSTLLLLFLLGCIQAELYRRTGSLWCPILLHAVNNIIDVTAIGLGS